jgi:uncharacterized protein (DUF1697 family)
MVVGVPRYVALLRGVNVGGVKLPMQDLRRVFHDLGHVDAVTYIQSGNVVFTCDADPARVGVEVEEQLAARLGLTVPVVLRSERELAGAIGANPFVERGVEASKLYMTFLASAPAPDRWARLEVPAGEPEEFSVGGTDIFLHYPDGYGRSKFHNGFIERRLGVAATTRNWNTVTKLLELAQG